MILGWAPEGAQPKITLNVGLRPPFAPAARFPVGPYLAPARNLPLGELIDTSFGAVRGPIRPETMFLEGPVVLETQGFGDPGNPGFWSQDLFGDFRCFFRFSPES